MATKKRTSGDDRKKSILDCAAQLVGKFGAKNVTRRMVAQKCKVSDALVAHYLGGVAEMQKKIKAHAKKLGIAEPAKDKIESIGADLRKKPRKNTVGKAPAKKTAAKSFAKTTSTDVSKATTAKKSAVTKGGAKRSASASAPRKRSVAEVKAIKDKAAGKRSAARAPKAPPVQPPLPIPPPMPAVPVV